VQERDLNSVGRGEPPILRRSDARAVSGSLLCLDGKVPLDGGADRWSTF